MWVGAARLGARSEQTGTDANGFGRYVAVGLDSEPRYRTMRPVKA